jgi:GSH-dependent disulfide-bond oxidoreductase
MPMLIFDRWPAKHPERIQLFSLSTPNGVKVSVALEELELPYEAHIVNIREGEQFTPEFISISPNSKIPAIVDPHGPGGKPIAMMESVAILLYLAEKAGRLLPVDPAERYECMQWLCFQVGHIGPMFGQFGHFYKYAADTCKDPYPVERYAHEARRLLGVLEHRLDGRDYIMGDVFTIADIAIFPWVVCLREFYLGGDRVGLDDFSVVNAWVQRCQTRPSYQRGKGVCSLA